MESLSEKSTEPMVGSGKLAESPELNAACDRLIELRRRPLLVLFYPPMARIMESDLDDVYEAFRRADAVPESPLSELDVLVESYGGDPVAGYRLAQLVRSFAEQVHVLVAEHAYSAATLFAFAAEQIRLAHFAGLSPIDITLTDDTDEEETKPRDEVELASIDSVMEFATTARRRVEETLQEMGAKTTTRVESDILVAMMNEIGALKVGKYFRERTLTGHYAEELLSGYMFRTRPDREFCCREVISNFLFGAPGHDVHLDLRLARRWGLAVEQMATRESDFVKSVVEVLDQLAGNQAICKRVSGNERQPFVAFYPVKEDLELQSNGRPQGAEANGEAREGARVEIQD